MKFYVMWLDCISLMTSDVEHIFMCLLDIYRPPFVYSSLSPIFYWVFVFWLWMHRRFHIAQIHVLRQVGELNIFKFVTCMYISLMVFLMERDF